MPVTGDTKTVGTRIFRYEGTPAAFRPWSPWAPNVYADTSLAAAKALVTIDGSVDEKVVELQDTTNDVAYIYVQKSTGYGVSFDASFDLLMRTDIGPDIASYTKAEAAAASFASGDFAYVSDIDTGTGFLMNANGTDLVSGKYWMQLGSSTIASSPSVGAIYPFLNQYWACLDATASAEVFIVTDQKDVTDYTGDQTLTAAQCKGGVITNKGASAAVNLTLPTAVAGLHVYVIKDAAYDLTVTAGASDTVQGLSAISNTTDGDVYGCIHLIATDAAEWKIATATGSWKDVELVTAHTGDATLNDDECHGQIHTNAGAGGAVNLTLPTCRAGLSLTVIKDAAQDLTITAGASDTINGAASILNDDTEDLYGAVTLVGTDAAEWKAVNANGGWLGIVDPTAVSDHASSVTLEASAMYGGHIHTNQGAGGAVVLTSPTEVEGMWIVLHKSANQNLTFNNSAAAAVIANTTGGETDKMISLRYSAGAWLVGPATGTWA